MGREWEEAVLRGSIDALQRLLASGTDIDGRSPSVVTWHDGEMFYLIASDKMSSAELGRIASET